MKILLLYYCYGANTCSVVQHIRETPGCDGVEPDSAQIPQSALN